MGSDTALLSVRNFYMLLKLLSIYTNYELNITAMIFEFVPTIWYCFVFHFIIQMNGNILSEILVCNGTLMNWTIRISPLCLPSDIRLSWYVILSVELCVVQEVVFFLFYLFVSSLWFTVVVTFARIAMCISSEYGTCFVFQ